MEIMIQFGKDRKVEIRLTKVGIIVSLVQLVIRISDLENHLRSLL